MTTLVGIFFSLVSVFGIFRGKSKTSIRKIVLIAFCIFLIIAQILFMCSTLDIGGQEFIFLSAILGGIILILAFQKNESW